MEVGGGLPICFIEKAAAIRTGTSCPAVSVNTWVWIGADWGAHSRGRTIHYESNTNTAALIASRFIELRKFLIIVAVLNNIGVKRKIEFSLTQHGKVDNRRNYNTANTSRKEQSTIIP